MKIQTLTEQHTAAYARFLREEERAPATIEKYLHDIRTFIAWLDSRPVTKELAAQWKERLLEDGAAPATVNTKISALNGLFKFLGREDCCVKFLRLQRQVFRDRSRELTREEYLRLLENARNTGKERLALLMEAVCSTGIRVSEVRALTVEAVRAGQACIRLKGKIRTILLPGKLCRKILKYAQKKKITFGEVFLTEGGKSLSRKQIWREMKALCAGAGVEPSKVFPHNLRHLFATTFYRVSRDIVKLADVLGHSSIETTRIYLVTTGAEHERYLNQLRLIC